MVKNVITILIVVVVGLGLVFAGGCSSDAQTAAAIGALGGAGVGQLAGRDTESTLIGAAIGGRAAYVTVNWGYFQNHLEEALRIQAARRPPEPRPQWPPEADR